MRNFTAFALAARLEGLEAAVRFQVEEFMMDTDVGFGSFYFYRPGADSQVFAGPLWDFDLSAGNSADAFSGVYEGLYASALNGTLSDHQWFAWRMGMEWFRNAVRERWREVSPLVDGVTGEVEERAKRCAQDFNLNFERWPVLGTNLWREPDVLMTLGSHEEHAAYLVRWLKGRKSWLDEAWK